MDQVSLELFALLFEFFIGSCVVRLWRELA